MAQFIGYLGYFFSIALFARIIISWFPVSATNPVVALIYMVTEPLLAPIRRVAPRLGTLDISPMIALLLISLVQRILLRALAG